MRRREQYEASDRLREGNYSRIAKKSGFALQHISRVLRGMAGCSFSAAVRIADAAGVTMDEFRAYIEKVKNEKAA